MKEFKDLTTEEKNDYIHLFAEEDTNNMDMKTLFDMAYYSQVKVYKDCWEDFKDRYDDLKSDEECL